MLNFTMQQHKTNVTKNIIPTFYVWLLFGLVPLHLTEGQIELQPLEHSSFLPHSCLLIKKKDKLNLKLL